jgi:ring-1,2-phenylacetyl-CoA epoxidase subunit PaaE
MNAIAQGARAPRFHRLKVAQVKRETPSAVSLSFAPPSELAGDFVFTPGQYLTLRATIGGEELRRSYSICSGPDEPELRVAVKEVEGGAFSSWVNRGLRAGDEIDVMTPTGRFGLTHGFQDGSVHVAFAAGSGVTPILSILRGVLAREPTSRFFLFYGSRTVEDVLFREALEELKDRYLGRLGVFHVLSREEQDISILNGHLDDAKVRQLLKTVVPAASVDHVFLCGPEAMIETISATLGDLGLAEDQIHVERFVSAHGGAPRAKPAPQPNAPAAHWISVIVDGKRRDAPVAEGEAILDAAIRAGIDLPFACKGGMCCTCRAKIVEGSAHMDVNYSLEKREVEAGFVLTCQAKPTSAKVVVDFDHM